MTPLQIFQNLWGHGLLGGAFSDMSHTLIPLNLQREATRTPPPPPAPAPDLFGGGMLSFKLQSSEGALVSALGSGSGSGI